MRAALVTEYRKLVTTRLWWILLLAMVVYMGFLSAVLAWALTAGGGMAGQPQGGEDDLVLTPDAVIRTAYTVAVSFGYVFPLIVGTLGMTSEFRHQTITPTFLAEPRRTLVLGAKLLSGAVVGLAYGVAGTAVSVAAGAGVLTLMGEPTYLDQADTWAILGRSVLALAVWAFVGVGFGAVLTNQVAAVVVILAFTQFVEPVARFVLALTEWGKDVASYLPGAAGEAISGGSFYSETGAGELLPWGWGLVLLLGYGFLFAVVGRVTTLRRDIT